MAGLHFYSIHGLPRTIPQISDQRHKGETTYLKIKEMDQSRHLGIIN